MALAINHVSEIAHYALANIYIAQRKFNDAQAHIDQLLELDPHDPRYYLLQADLNKLQRKYDLTDFQELNRVFSNPLSQDTDGDSLADGLEFNFFGVSPVLADTDGALSDRYYDPCAGLSGVSLLLCQSSCNVTPTFQIFDQSGMTVDDGCARQGTGQCIACVYDEDRVRSVLDSILPPKWCGEATP